MQNNSLKLQPIAIGSLPYSNTQEAMKLVAKDFSNIPFFPQLAKVSKNEDMIIQFLEGMPSFFGSKAENFYFDSEDDKFWLDVEDLFTDYEEIITGSNFEKLDKYAISDNFSSTFSLFEKQIKTTKPPYAKGQIIGPFTLGVSLTDKDGKCAIYDETLKDIIVKLLSLKAVWQINRIKQANPQTIPIIFLDEPCISQLGTSAYMTIPNEEVIQMLNEVAMLIKYFGGICGVHCCGKCDWSIPISAGFDIINPDAFNYAQNFSIYSSKINKFLNSGGKIAWGIIPTLNIQALETLTTNDLAEIFEKSVKYLTKKGIDEKLIKDNSLITSSCGAGSLSVEQAKRAMDFINELAGLLKERYKI